MAAACRACAAFATSEFPRPWPGVLRNLCHTRALGVIERLIDGECRRPLTQARLAQADFDVTPIFCADGRYTGIVDSGEIRGAEPLFDLAISSSTPASHGLPCCFPASCSAISGSSRSRAVIFVTWCH